MRHIAEALVRVALPVALFLVILPAALAGPLTYAPHGPTLRSPTPESMGGYGLRVLALGDVEGDGWGDLALSDPLDGPGRVLIHVGAAEGLPSENAAPDGVLTGSGEGDQFGAALAVGDWDGDGRPDLLVGAPRAAGLAGQPRTGRVYVFLAHQLLAATPASAAAAVLVGEGQDDRFGSALAFGPGDVAVASAPLRDEGRGVVYAVGPGLAGTHPVGEVSSATWTGEEPADELGQWGLAALGDVDGDGGGDLAVSSTLQGRSDHGRVYLLRGGGPSGAVSAAAARTWDGEAAGDHAGFALALHRGPGPKLLVGAPGSDAPGPAAGRAYLLDPLAPSGPLLARASAVLEGTGGGALGRALASGDFDGDGHAEVLAGAPLLRQATESRGAVFLFPGPVAPGVADAQGRVALLLGNTDSSRFGAALALVAQPDAAHAAGLLVGAPRLGGQAHLLLNLPPAADFEAPVVPCGGPLTPLLLDASRSSDPDGDADLQAYRWTAVAPDLGQLGQGKDVSVSLPLGTTTVRLEVEDAYLARDEVTKGVVVYDDVAPTVTLRRAQEGELYVGDREPLPDLQVPLVGWSTHVGHLTFEADASDACSAVDRVEFWRDHTLAHVDREAPYTFTYDPHELVPAFERLRALAFDEQGNGPAEDCLAVVNPGWVGPHHLPVAGEGPPPHEDWGLPPDDVLHVVTHGDPCPGEFQLPLGLAVPLRLG